MTIEYDQLEANAANFVALTPLSFLQRTADIYPQREALIYNQRRYSWAQVRNRCTRIGAVLNTINTRLDADTVAYIIDHAESRMFICDRQLWPVLEDALQSCTTRPEIVIIDDIDATEKPALPTDSEFSFYEDLVDRGDDTYSWCPPETEWQALTLSYTSGTTGRPKGVVYHHRGSYLMTMGTVVSWALPPHPRYLYTVPMFHCNGWGHAWTMTALAATIVCLRAFVPKLFFELVEEHEVTHFGGAPIVLNMLALAPKEDQKRFVHTVHAMTAGAPPPAKVLESMAQFNLEVMHVYGLTETYGHILHSAPQDDWYQQSIERQAELKARQGVRFAMTEAVDVIDPESGKPVPWDAETMGEIVIRGNTVMKGYLKDPAATAEAFAGGWFRSGDIAVVFPDGYIQVKDRAKDVIISGGENISSVEVEGVLYRHPAVGDAAVVALEDEKWGEVPCAFVELRPGVETSEQQLIDFCADNMARFKRPKKVVFGELPKTATGKIQKNVLRERAKQL